MYASELAKTVNANTRAELQKGFGGVFWFKKIRPVDEFLIKQAACQGGARRQKSVGRGVDVGVKRLRNAMLAFAIVTSRKHISPNPHNKMFASEKQDTIEESCQLRKDAQ